MQMHARFSAFATASPVKGETATAIVEAQFDGLAEYATARDAAAKRLHELAGSTAPFMQTEIDGTLHSRLPLADVMKGVKAREAEAKRIKAEADARAKQRSERSEATVASDGDEAVDTSERDERELPIGG